MHDNILVLPNVKAFWLYIRFAVMFRFVEILCMGISILYVVAYGRSGKMKMFFFSDLSLRKVQFEKK